MQKTSLIIKAMLKKGIRTALVLTGIAVGVLSTLIIGAISVAGENAVSNELDSLGLNGISVESKSTYNPLSVEDASLVCNANGVESATPFYTIESEIKLYDKSFLSTLWGSTFGKDNNNRVFHVNTIYGRDFNLSEINDGAEVVLIDKVISNALFGRDNSVGKTVDVSFPNGVVKCKIIGITTSDSELLKSVTGQMVPEFAYAPYKLLNKYGANGRVGSIAVKLNDDADSNEVSKQIISILDKDNNTENGYSIDNLSTQRSTLDNIMSIVSKILFVISLVSIAVSGLGIMTVMLVSVNERTREIGVKKAIGASFFDILKEFLSEALILSFFGCILGIALAYIICFIISTALATAFYPSISYVTVSVISAVLCGVLFGLYPAIKAAKMRPVNALRYE